MVGTAWMAVPRKIGFHEDLAIGDDRRNVREKLSGSTGGYERTAVGKRVWDVPEDQCRGSDRSNTLRLGCSCSSSHRFLPPELIDPSNQNILVADGAINSAGRIGRNNMLLGGLMVDEPGTDQGVPYRTKQP